MLSLVASAVGPPPPGVNNTLMVALAVSAICGWAIPVLTDLVTKAACSTAVKTAIATALAALAGVLTTVAYVPNERWQDYFFAIAVAFVNTHAAHRTLKGLGDPVQAAAGNVGIGPSNRGTTANNLPNDSGEIGLLLVVLVLLALIFFGLGFAVKWLFIIAVVLVILALISAFGRGPRA